MQPGHATKPARKKGRNYTRALFESFALNSALMYLNFKLLQAPDIVALPVIVILASMWAVFRERALDHADH